MPVDRRKAGAAPAAVGGFGDEKVLTLRDVEEAYEQRVSAHQRRSRHKKRKARSACLSSALQLLFAVTARIVTGGAILWTVYAVYRTNYPHSLNHAQAGRLHQERVARQNRRSSAEPFLEPTNHTSEYTGPQIAWLMSFPNSGTSYTSRLVRDASQTVTASNYADETPRGAQGWREAVFTEQPSGPFWVKPEASPEYTEPTAFVLTKTHCGIRCNPCSPEEQAETTYSFRRRCLVTKWAQPGSDGNNNNRYSTYPADRVTKAVHLLRNPFDNVVSRFHLENQKNKKYSSDKHGFLKYCLTIDYLYTESETKYMHFGNNKILSDLWQVPCHADFLRYVEWHNLAFWVTRDLELDELIVHYEDYNQDTSFNATVDALLEFLHLPRRAEPTPFAQQHSYDDYFTAEERRIVRAALQFAASRETWRHIRHYFEHDDAQQQRVG